MTTLVTGSRGKVGSTLIQLLRDHGTDVRAASARPDELAVPTGVTTVRVDLRDPATFADALDTVDSVFLYAEPAQIGAFLERAESAGVQHIVLLSSSSVLDPASADSPIVASHLAVEQALGVTAIETTVLQPGAFAANALQWSWALKGGGAIDLPYPGSYTDPIHERDIADAALAVLTESGLRGTSYHLTGPRSLTFAGQIAALERATGLTIPVNHVSPDAWKKSVSDYLSPAFADALLGYWAANDGIPTPITRNVEVLTGHPARTFDTWAAENADAFRTPSGPSPA
ncbi:NAD(P)H-binding protein [Streptomyces sp. NPDC051320]|uniref:SDR family oxidoreductase n=1 Tax=Streptomyces sp. NPDC051320 TaxID=3154644 RepID=UPI0034258CF9